MGVMQTLPQDVVLSLRSLRVIKALALLFLPVQRAEDLSRRL
jgi:hypothetical protein